ncbi:hypothetical protein BS78_06G246900 [Paspalum vaginatum]|nr:hypothetical protein BS78_06G246900 [Paspalum vaginatum]
MGAHFQKKEHFVMKVAKYRIFEKLTVTEHHFDIVDLAKEVGFQDEEEIFCTIPGFDLESGIDKIHDDQSVGKMLTSAKKSGVIELYVQPRTAQVPPTNANGGPTSRRKTEREVHHYLFTCIF